MAERPVVIVSNRGPVSFVVDDAGRPVERRGSGGLVSGLQSLGDRGTTWFAAALTDGDRMVATAGPRTAAGFDIRLLAIDPSTYRLAYDVIANETLWFLHHDLFDLTREPRFDDRWREAWDAYREVNAAFADAVADDCPAGAVVLVQDYHLALMGQLLAERRPDLHAVHFHHTPFCSAAELEILPDDVAGELLDGLAGFRACGFHTHRWASNFASGSARASMTPTFVAPLAIEADEVLAASRHPQCEQELTRIDELVGDRALIARVDRIELSKNMLRGFDAFDLLLEREPSWRGRVVFGAFCYPSRQGVEAYVRYRAEVEERAAQINERWVTSGWVPIVLETDDHYYRSLAALRRADALVVNPIRDGLNLVAKEFAVVNERDGGLVLSRGAGVHDELHSWVDSVNPFDVAATADAMLAAVTRPARDRRDRATRRRHAVTSRTPDDWLRDQLDAAATAHVG